MAYYALINNENVVEQVISGVDENVTQIDTDGTEIGGSTEAWETFYSNLPWFAGLYCKRTSFNNNIRKQYAGIGFTYNEMNDVFISPQPFASWLLNEDFDWQAPTPRPQEGSWTWNEETVTWVAVG